MLQSDLRGEKMRNWNTEYGLITKIIQSEFETDFLYTKVINTLNNEYEIIPIQFAALDPYKAYNTSQVSRILRIKSNQLRYLINKYGEYIQLIKKRAKYVISFKALYRIYLLNLCLTKKLFNLAEFNSIMTSHVSYSDYIDMKLTSYTDKFVELNYKTSQLNENESEFYVLFLQISEISTELIKEIAEYNMTLTSPFLSVDNRERTKLVNKKRDHEVLFNKLSILYKIL
ncbi:hypothetical protein IEC_05501 [Bacillus toyonensis]|uniref:hypothetical protein n=1 Tax=Bacillus cereus group TaxID=86661 RepID=UPI000278CBCF|nr:MULTISPECIES: hypothetical protein [Bacillus cereus group]OFD02277.1 hypothetical protein BTGOE7_52660 [Bacillus thuringiensis]EJQ31559.1 hypothetical protein IEC_05501 [Bacillus toyonensis]KAB2357138.1 hypothetical protein F8503_23800 [Bacillus toyonensis]MBJ8048091.1 hypothetical protein [Bacillus cereus group sp. N18]MCG3796919.1 hypothetical protein [Bacillus toyonensis]